MATEFIEISEEEYQGGPSDFIEITEEEFNTPQEPAGTSLGDTLQTAAEELEAGVGRAGSAFAKSAVGSVRMFTDLFGANNKVSKEIAGVEDYIDQFTTAQAKQDKEEISRLFQEAEGKGLGNKVMAGLKAVAVSPETLGPEMAGYMLPSLAAGLLTGGASIPVQIGAQATIGAAQAAGSIKGDIYQSVRDYSREQGLNEVEADRAATEAQSYGGKNLDLILTNAGIGALAASTGAERIATRILTGRGKDVTKKTLGEFLKQGAMAGGVEALTEGTQEAAEQISQNIALQREGKDVPTFQNVPQVATMGAVAGGVIGGGLKGVEFLSAEEKAERDINRSADREARSLSATDSTTKKVINDLNQSENAIDSLRQELDTLEPTDPKAQQLRMRISEEQKKATGLKQSLGEEFLSEPITTIEEQQAELAKAITTPEAAPAPAPVEEVVTPPVEVAQFKTQEIPLGINRPTVVDKSLRILTDEEFNKSYITAKDNVDNAEAMIDAAGGSSNLTTDQRTQIAEAQDKWSSVEIENFRRSNQDVNTEDLFDKMISLADTGSDSSYTEFSTLMDIIQERGGAKPEQVIALKRILPKQLLDNPNYQEALKGKLTKFKEWMGRYQSEKSEVEPTIAEAAPVTEQAAPAEAPAPKVAPVEEKIFQPDDELVMRSPYTGEDTIVSYRGKPSDGQAVVWTGKMQMQIPEFWLRKKGEEFTGKETEGEAAPKIVAEEIVQETPKEEVEKPLPKTKKGLVEELAGEEPKDYALAQDWKKTVAALNKQTKEELAFKVSNYRENGKKLKATQKITSELFPKIKETVDAAGNKWVQALKTIASENGLEKWTTLEGNSKGEEIYRLANRIAYSQINAPKAPTPVVSETITPAAEPTGIAVGNRIRLGRSPQTYTIEEVISQSETEKANGEQYYSVKNEKTGETQVVEKADMKPVKKSADTRKTVVGDTQYQTEGVIPEAERFTEDELRVIVNDIFGGKIPDKIKIITDTTDPNKEFKAAYSIRKGTITYNLAYLAKGDDLNFVTNHELGHYILGDPKFQGEMARLFDSLPADIQEKLKVAIDEAYAQEGLGVRAEETIVFAFGEILENAPDGRNILQRFLDAIRDAINRLFKTEGYIPRNPKKAAAAILMAARNRFEQGEFIRRPNGSVVNIVPDIRRMAVRRTRIMSVEAGEEVETQEAIIAKTKDLLRKQFDPTKVTEKNTTEAFRALGKLAGNRKEALAYAEELNDIGRLVDESGAASEISMGAALFINDLFEYSIRLAAEGDSKMLGIMMANINRLPTAMIGASDAGRTLAARAELKARFIMMGRAEQDAYTNYVAEFIYGPNPTKEQIQSIKDAYAKVEKTPQVTEQELTDEIKAVGDRAGTDLVGKINEEFTKATEKGKEKRRTEEQELDREYKKVQKQADAEIEKLAKIQSDTPSFDPAAARQTANDVRAIVANDLKQRPDMGRKAPWKSMLVAKLQEAGVELTAAETLADIVWRQHEINNLSRELSSINKAIEKGPISEIIKAIKDTPLEEQQKPNWRYEVMRDYLRKAGLNVAQSERIAKLMDISLQKRFTMAQEQAFTDAISKSAPWKNGDTRSRRAFQKVLQALRAGALDPTRNVLSDMAALNGWTGFTPEQYKALLKYDAILANPETKQADLAEAHKAIQNIISKAKLPIRARDVIGQYYDAQALSGITTMTVNIFSPAGVAAKNALVQSLNGLVTARPEQITAAMTTFVDSIKSWANTVAYSFKNNVTVYSNVEYLVNDEGLLKLYNRGVDQFKNGKTPRERADGVKNMMIGMMDYVRRVLNALDYGAIASLQNQAVSKYALAAMQAKGMSSKDGAKMLNAMMEQKRIFYNDQIAIGTDKNKAAVLADEFFISAWRQALTDAKLPAQEVIDAALNDAMSAVGRNRQSLDAFLEEETNTRDQGLLSFPAIWLLETMANAANKQDSQFIKIFSRIIYGFAIVPARVFREAAWFSPLAAHRFAYEYIAKKKGLKSRYAQSLGNDLQYRQRLTETIAGSIVMLAFGAAMTPSTEDEEDKKPFKIVITGNGPLRRDDPQFYDSWMKNNRPNTVSVYFGETKFTINTMRGFEAFAWPAMMLGAVDDWHIRRKQGRTTNTPLQMQDGAIVAGNILSASLRRGPYAFAAKPLFEAYGDRGVESLAKSLAFPAKTLVPVLGSSLAKNISDFLNEPMDRRTLEGALWSNVPFIGPTIAPKSLNAFGEPALASDSADKIFKLGVPIVYDIPNDRNSIMVHELVLKQGGGPSIPNRSQVAKRLDREPTNKEFEMFVKEYGAEIKRVMSENIEELSAMDGPDYDRAMEYIGNNARDMAQAKLMESK